MFHPHDYATVFGAHVSAGLARMVEKRIELSRETEDPLDDLLGAADDRLLDWMRRKAQLADGTTVGLPVCDAEEVAEVLADARSTHGEWNVVVSRKSVSAWPQIQVALMRELCGSSWSEIAARTELSMNGAWKAYQRHQHCVAEDELYGARAAALVAAALRHCYRHEVAKRE